MQLYSSDFSPHGSRGIRQYITYEETLVFEQVSQAAVGFFFGNIGEFTFKCHYTTSTTSNMTETRTLQVAHKKNGVTVRVQTLNMYLISVNRTVSPFYLMNFIWFDFTEFSSSDWTRSSLAPLRSSTLIFDINRLIFFHTKMRSSKM